jgi:hypothetical protein
MKRTLLVLLGIAALYFGGRALRRALVSDETRISWVLDDMCEGFGATRMNPVMAGLAVEYTDEALGADRDLVKLGLAHLFFEQSGGADKRFPYRVEWRSEAGPRVDASGEEKTAEMELELEIFRREGEAENVVWKAKVDAQLRKRDGEWRFVRTHTTTIDGRIPR